MRRLLRPAVAALAVATLTACALVDPDTRDGGAGRLTAEQVTSLVADSLEEHRSVLMTLDGSTTGGSEQIEATVAVSRHGDPQHVEITRGTVPEQMKMLFVGDALYLRIGDGELVPGKTWGLVDPTSDDYYTQMLASQANAFRRFADPVEEALTGATGTLVSTRTKGDATVYTVDVDLADAMREVDVRAYLTALEDADEQLAALAPELAEGGKGLEDLTGAELERLRAVLVSRYEGVKSRARIAVGSDGLPVAVRTQRTGNGPDDFTMTVTYTGWGTTTVQPPPAADVTPMPALSGDG